MSAICHQDFDHDELQLWFDHLECMPDFVLRSTQDAKRLTEMLVEKNILTLTHFFEIVSNTNPDQI